MGRATLSLNVSTESWIDLTRHWYWEKIRDVISTLIAGMPLRPLISTGLFIGREAFCWQKERLLGIKRKSSPYWGLILTVRSPIKTLSWKLKKKKKKKHSEDSVQIHVRPMLVVSVPMSWYVPCLVDSKSLALPVSSLKDPCSSGVPFPLWHLYSFCFLFWRIPWALSGKSWWDLPFRLAL